MQDNVYGSGGQTFASKQGYYTLATHNGELDMQASNHIPFSVPRQCTNNFAAFHAAVTRTNFRKHQSVPYHSSLQISA